MKLFDENQRWINISKLNKVLNNLLENNSSSNINTYWGDPVQNISDLPSGKNKGYICFVFETNTFHYYDGTKYVNTEEPITNDEIDNLLK